MTIPGMRWLRFLGPLALLGFGLFVGLMLNRPTPPWMDFTALDAYYQLGGREITTDGAYTVRRECDPGNDRLPIGIQERTDLVGEERVIWRYEAIATDGQIAIYGPKPPAPSFALGEHHYTGSIPLLQEINPDGWVVRILITCPGESPETVASPPAKVEIVLSAP